MTKPNISINGKPRNQSSFRLQMTPDYGGYIRSMFIGSISIEHITRTELLELLQLSQIEIILPDFNMILTVIMASAYAQHVGYTGTDKVDILDWDCEFNIISKRVIESGE